MSFQFLSFEMDTEGIGLLTIQRPEKRNALNSQVIEELCGVFSEWRENSKGKALILTGAGDKAFAAGADIGEISSASPIDAERLSRRGQEVFRLLETARKPSVAAINGVALGGGLELALCATIRIAASHVKLGAPEVKLGLVPGYGATQRLPRLVGKGRAMELLLTGDTIDAAEAYRIGLVNAVCEQPALIDTAKKWVRGVLANGPVAAGLVMEAVDVGWEAGVASGLRYESAAFALASSTEDMREGTMAFLEKRRPNFTGR